MPMFASDHTATLLAQEMCRRGLVAGDCALMPVYLRCGCIWYSFRSVSDLAETIQHGENAEQSRRFTVKVHEAGELCANGHVREVEEWAADVIHYAHPEEA